jgi:hypothetical protein
MVQYALTSQLSISVARMVWRCANSRDWIELQRRLCDSDSADEEDDDDNEEFPNKNTANLLNPFNLNKCIQALVPCKYKEITLSLLLDCIW